MLNATMDATQSVDFARLERGLGLHAERKGRGQYHITGGKADHWVDLYTADIPRCDCGDFIWREHTCKHILAAMLREGNEQVVQAIGSLVVQLKK